MSALPLLAAAAICVTGTAPDGILAPLLCPKAVHGEGTPRDGSALQKPEDRGPGSLQITVSLRYLAQREQQLEFVATRRAKRPLTPEQANKRVETPLKFAMALVQKLIEELDQDLQLFY